MKRNIVIVVAGILLLIMLSLFYTYATSVTMDETSGSADLTYNVNLSDPETTTITVEPGKTKYFDIIVTNTNGGAINYGLAYDQVETDAVLVAQTDLSLYKAIDTIENNETRQISLVIKNDTSSDITYNILPVTGYVNGGDLPTPTNHTLIDDVYSYTSGTITGSVSDYVPGGGTGGGSGGSGGETGSTDPSGANSPDLVQGLVPITYDGSKWIRANSSNSDTSWYNYSEKKWANAALVTSTYRNSDGTDKFNVGDEVPEDAILAYYVWIPRYKYKVFNINKVIGTDSYSASTTGIDIVFERETATTGTIRCNNYSFAAPSSSANSPNETCSGSNGDYYTHPAFKFGNTELRGLWISKFEISSSSPTTSYGGGNLTYLTVRSKPNVNSWRNNYLTNFSYVIQNMSIENNEYGLKTDSNSHMLKNQEWGAVAYLTHSGYGRCSGDGCEEVALNSYSSYMTGCGPQSEGNTKSGSTCNAYNTELGQLASTTGNIYGVYDMSGGAFEYVMGNMSSAAGSYTYYTSSGGSNFEYSEDTAKYIDTYANGSSFDEQTAYNRARLGDATGEVAKSSGSGWNEDYAFFVYSIGSWFFRSGFYSGGSSAGVFNFSGDTGTFDSGASARACLVGGA